MVSTKHMKQHNCFNIDNDKKKCLSSSKSSNHNDFWTIPGLWRQE